MSNAYDNVIMYNKLGKYRATEPQLDVYGSNTIVQTMEPTMSQTDKDRAQ